MFIGCLFEGSLFAGGLTGWHQRKNIFLGAPKRLLHWQPDTCTRCQHHSAPLQQRYPGMLPATFGRSVIAPTRTASSPLPSWCGAWLPPQETGFQIQIQATNLNHQQRVTAFKHKVGRKGPRLVDGQANHLHRNTPIPRLQC